MTRRDDIIRESTHAAHARTAAGRRLLFVLAGVGVALLLLAGAIFYHAYTNTRDQAESGTALASQVQAACADPSERKSLPSGFCSSADRVVEDAERIGIPVQGDPGPQGEQGPQGDTGEQGPPPSQGAVLAAVALYCNEGLCDGKDGKDPSAEQVAQAVATYCDVNGKCRGDAGEDSEVPGPQGPPPTPEQITAAVAEFCGESNCDGPAGPSGPSGPAGVDGLDAVPFQFTFTIPGDNPVEPDRTYTIRCTDANRDNCAVTAESGN